MDVIKVEDIATQRKLEVLDGTISSQAGMIDYIACMADVDMPESDTEEEGGRRE